jgi:hypothetical protein
MNCGYDPCQCKEIEEERELRREQERDEQRRIENDRRGPSGCEDDDDLREQD